MIRCIISLFFCTALVTLTPRLAIGQSIETGTVNTAYCKNDTLHVSFTATDSFQPGNVFILQLSGPGGDFSEGFVNLGSISQTSSGTVSVKVDNRFKSGVEYRVRINASNPPVTGLPSENSFVILTPLPKPEIIIPEENIWENTFINYVLETEPISLTAQGIALGTAVHWDFGNGAVPATSQELIPPAVRYISPGIKTITLTVGDVANCKTKNTAQLEVFPTVVTIPSNAVAITPGSEYQPTNPYEHLWICPGAVYTCATLLEPIIYVEPGAHINGDGEGTGIAYVKAGASISKYTSRTFFTDSSGLDVEPKWYAAHMVRLPQISFDYSVAPIGGCPSLAPYSIPVSTTTEIVTTSQSGDDGGKKFLIETDGVLYATGQFNHYLINPGGQVDAKGDYCTVYLKKGGVFNATDSKHHRIFFEEGADIGKAGEESILIPASTINFIIDETVEVRDIPTRYSRTDVAVYPNPVGDELVVYCNGIQKNAVVTLFNLLGNTILQGSIQENTEIKKFDVASFPRGIYILRMQTEDMIRHITVILQ